MARSFIDGSNIAEMQRDIASTIISALYKAGRDASKSVTKMVNQKRTAAFRTAIKEFYTDPGFSISNAGYERKESLYNIFETISYVDEESGLTQPDYFYDDSKMTAFRGRTDYESNGLFDQVYVKGWHGGADRIDPSKVHYPFQNHPSIGTPHYRYPAPYYRYWGRRAAVLNPPPIKRFERYSENAIQNLNPVAQKIFNDNIGREIEAAVVNLARRW